MNDSLGYDSSEASPSKLYDYQDNKNSPGLRPIPYSSQLLKLNQSFYQHFIILKLDNK